MTRTANGLAVENIFPDGLNKGMNMTVSEKLCSRCGLCMVEAWTPAESRQACVFQTGWLGRHEQTVFGRQRIRDDIDEALFGISSERFVAINRQRLPGVQFTGIITGIALKAFETKLADAVVTLHRSSEDYFFPVPVLAQTSEQILAGSGSKPVLAQTLRSLEDAYKKGIKRLLVIASPCQVHNLLEFKKRFDYLSGMELYIVGIPCTDNVYPENFRYILSRISRSHETVRHFEFMQDFTVHLRHSDGCLERMPFFCLPKELASAELLTPCCRSCFDYMNSLADITVGYLAAPLDVEKMYQWVAVRTEKGSRLKSLIEADLEILPESSDGDRTTAVQHYCHQLLEQMNKTGNTPDAQSPMTLEEGLEFAAYLSEIGPRGLEFARYAIETHLIRNYCFVKNSYPNLLQPLVPDHVYFIVKNYGLAL